MFHTRGRAPKLKPTSAPRSGTAATTNSLPSLASGVSESYLELPDDGWPDGHPRTRWCRYASEVVAYDRFAADLSRTTFADPYALLGLKFGFRTKKGTSFFIEARNLTDKNYSPTTGVVQNATLPAQSAVFLPGDGRAFYAGVEFKW